MKKMKMSRLLLVTVLSLCTLLLLSACKMLGENTATQLVKGNLDHVYLGQYDSDYLELIDETEQEAESDYLEGLAAEADFFAYYWGIILEDESFSDLDEDLQKAIVDLYHEIYSHSKYEVQPASGQRDGSYTVKVLVQPIDIMVQAEELVANQAYAPLENFYEQTADMDWENMTEQEYWNYTNEYGWIIVEMVESLLPNLGYQDQKSQVLQVDEVDGYLQINSDDFQIFDNYVITYP